MNKKQRNYFRMFIGTQEFLDNESTIWTSIKRIAFYKNDLDEIIARIMTKSEDAGSMIGIGNRKETLKSIIAVKGSSLSGAMQAFAYDNGDTDLAEKVKASKPDIHKMKEEDLGDYIHMLAETTNDNKSAVGLWSK